METRLSTEPLLSKTSVNNTQQSIPGTPVITLNPPTMTYAGGRPLYAQQGTDVVFNNLTLTGSLNAQSFSVSTMSVSTLTANTGNISSFTSARINLDGNILTTAGTAPSELLLNGIPIATTSNISSLADWAFEPAISSVNFNLNDLYNVSTINGQPYNTFLPIDVGNWANYKAVSSINVDNGYLLNTGQIRFNSASSNILTTDVSNNLIYNGSNISGGGGGNVSDWATYPAVANVQMNGNNITTTNSVAINAIAGLSAPIPTISLYSQGGIGGAVNITADSGYGGISYGRVSITAEGGSTGDVITGGLVEINANTPVGIVPSVTSAVKISASGINSYAGAVPSIGSLAGYNFIYGTAGVNICAGVPSILPNIAGTTYLYGTNGVVLNSDVYTTQVYPYWNGITAEIADLVISGRDAVPLIHGPAYVKLDHVSNIDGSNLAITGVSTINGAVYPPPASAISVPATSVLFSTDGTTITGDSNMTFAVEGQRLTANNITASFDLTINSDASLNVGGSTGNPGQVVARTTGDYPVWSFPPPPSVITITLNGIDTITEVPDLGRYYPVDTDVGGTNYTIVFDVSAVAGGTSWYIKNLNAIPVSIRYDAGAGITDATFFGGAVALTPEQGYSVCAWDGATLTIY